MNKVSKVAYIISGIIFLLVGFAGFGASVYIYKNPFKEAKMEVVKSKAIKQCSSLIRNKGFQAIPSSSKGTIEVIHGDLTQWETSLGKMSYIFQSCEAMEMTDFCMGESCSSSNGGSTPGIVAKLKYKEPEKNK